MWLSTYPASIDGCTLIRFLFACDNGMGEMRRANAREEAGRRLHDPFTSTVIIAAAAIIAAVRLPREPDIGRPSPRLFAVIADSVALARLILKRVAG